MNNPSSIQWKVHVNNIMQNDNKTKAMTLYIQTKNVDSTFVLK